MANDPWTGARLGANSDAPLGGQYLAEVVNEVGKWTVPAFATAAARDSALTAWIANGNTAQDGMRCWVVGVGDQVRVSGSWVTIGGSVPYPAPFGYLIGSGTQNVASGTETAILLNTQQRLINMTATLSGGIVKATVAGWYMVSGGVTFDSSSASGRRIVGIMKNGTSIDQSQNQSYVPNGVNLAVCSAALPVSMNVNDYVQVFANQVTGTTVTVERGSSFLSVSWIGPLTP